MKIRINHDDAVAIAVTAGCSLFFWVFVMLLVRTIDPKPLGLSHETLVFVRAK